MSRPFALPKLHGVVSGQSFCPGPAPTDGGTLEELTGSAASPPDAAAGPKPSMIAEARDPLSVKDHPIAVCALALFGAKIGLRLAVRPSPPLRG